MSFVFFNLLNVVVIKCSFSFLNCFDFMLYEHLLIIPLFFLVLFIISGAF